MDTLKSSESECIPQEILAEAKELCRGSEVLPDGAEGLARRIWEAKKEGRKLRVKLGVDPTSTDLHLGHAVQFRKLRRFQEFGHQVVLIIGGFTAQIGDPSGRDKTRPPLDSAAVAANAQTYINQMGLILNMQETEVVNNADWLAPLDLSKVLQLASHATVSQMLAKEAFGERMEKQQPICLHELFYPLLQAYDSVAINCDIELGGTDQRFNILQGRDLMPRYGLKPQFGMFLPLLEGTDGVQKMSKSYGNYIALKDEPSEMFGKCMRIPDTLIVKYFELATTLSGSEIDSIENSLKSGANPKDFKEKLGHQIVRQYHGDEAAEQALAEWKKVHSAREMPEEIVKHHSPLSKETTLAKALVELGLATTGGDAKRLVQEGAVRVNSLQIKEPHKKLGELSSEAELVLQKGRRDFIRIELV